MPATLTQAPFAQLSRAESESLNVYWLLVVALRQYLSVCSLLSENAGLVTSTVVPSKIWYDSSLAQVMQRFVTATNTCPSSQVSSLRTAETTHKTWETSSYIRVEQNQSSSLEENWKLPPSSICISCMFRAANPLGDPLRKRWASYAFSKTLTLVGRVTLPLNSIFLVDGALSHSAAQCQANT